MQPISFQLECIAPPSFPAASFTWITGDGVDHKNYIPVTESMCLTIDLKRNLHFANVIQNDQMGTNIYLSSMRNWVLATTVLGCQSRIKVNPGISIFFI